MVCTKLNCIWYLHFYGIKSDFMGVCIQNLGFRFRVVWLKSPGVLLKKLQQNNWTSCFSKGMNVHVVTAVGHVQFKYNCFSSYFNEIQNGSFSEITLLAIKCLSLRKKDIFAFLLRKVVVQKVFLVDS